MTDPRRLVELLLRDDASLSDRRVAEQVGVSHQSVGRIRRELVRTGRIASPAERVTADGRHRPVAVRGPDATWDGGLAATVERLWRAAT
jgi:DNA-binding Lrp family transcriptional regulator